MGRPSKTAVFLTRQAILGMVVAFFVPVMDVAPSHDTLPRELSRGERLFMAPNSFRRPLARSYPDIMSG